MYVYSYVRVPICNIARLFVIVVICLPYIPLTLTSTLAMPTPDTPGNGPSKSRFSFNLPSARSLFDPCWIELLLGAGTRGIYITFRCRAKAYGKIVCENLRNYYFSKHFINVKKYLKIPSLPSNKIKTLTFCLTSRKFHPCRDFPRRGGQTRTRTQ